MSLGAQDRQNYLLNAIIAWAKHLLAKNRQFFWYNLLFMWGHWVNLQEMMKGNTLTGNSWHSLSKFALYTCSSYFPTGTFISKSTFQITYLSKRGKQYSIIIKKHTQKKKYNMSGCFSQWVNCFSTTQSSSFFAAQLYALWAIHPLAPNSL